jgi:hypothetical protein
MEQESISKKEKYEVDAKSFEHHVWFLFKFVKQLQPSILFIINLCLSFKWQMRT